VGGTKVVFGLAVAATQLLLAGLLVFGGASSANAVLIDFEDALGDDNDTFIVANGDIYKGLNWKNPSLANDYQIDVGNAPFASFGGGVRWLQGFAEGVPNRAKIGRVADDSSFEFVSMALRTRFEADALGVDALGDGVDDRWLTEVTLRFRDVNNNESLTTVDLASAGDWILLEAAGVSGAADLSQLKAIFFEGDSGTTVSGVRNDRFAIDNLHISAPVPEPSAALCFAVGSLVVGAACRRRR